MAVPPATPAQSSGSAGLSHENISNNMDSSIFFMMNIEIYEKKYITMSISLFILDYTQDLFISNYFLILYSIAASTFRHVLSLFLHKYNS